MKNKTRAGGRASHTLCPPGEKEKEEEKKRTRATRSASELPSRDAGRLYAAVTRKTTLLWQAESAWHVRARVCGARKLRTHGCRAEKMLFCASFEKV